MAASERKTRPANDSADQLHRELSHREGNLNQQRSARRVPGEVDLELHAGGSTLQTANDFVRLDGLVRDRDGLRAGVVEAHFIEAAKQHLLRRRNASLTQLAAGVEKKGQGILYAVRGGEFAGAAAIHSSARDSLAGTVDGFLLAPLTCAVGEPPRKV